MIPMNYEERKNALITACIEDQKYFMDFIKYGDFDSAFSYAIACGMRLGIEETRKIYSA
jgi:hypothetical protein